MLRGIQANLGARTNWDEDCLACSGWGSPIEPLMSRNATRARRPTRAWRS